jgi:hypothetical protein
MIGIRKHRENRFGTFIIIHPIREVSLFFSLLPRTRRQGDARGDFFFLLVFGLSFPGHLFVFQLRFYFSLLNCGVQTNGTRAACRTGLMCDVSRCLQPRSLVSQRSHTLTSPLLTSRSPPVSARCRENDWKGRRAV